MTSTGDKPVLSLSQQITKCLPKEAMGYRLIHTCGSPVIPDVNKPPYPKGLLVQPAGLPDGEYYVESYDAEGQILADPSGEAAVVSLWRRKPTAPVMVQAAAASLAPAAAPATVPAATASPVPAPAAAPVDDWSANPDKWAHKLQIRQDHQMRDLGVAVFQQGIEQLKEIRDIYATIGQEQYQNQRLALDYGKEVFALQRALLEERKTELSQRSQEKDEESPRAKVDYTQLGMGILATIQAIGTALVSRRSDARPDEPEKAKKPEKADKVSSKTERVILVPEEQAEQAMEELMKFCSPMELQKLLSDPAEQKRFAGRLAEITGNPASKQLVKKSGGSTP